MLTPRSQWSRAGTQDELVSQIRESLEGMPGMRVIISQPIEMRVNEMTAGVRSDVAIKIFGDDMQTLKQKAEQVQEILETMPGSADIYVEQLTGQPVLEIQVDQQAIARFGVPASHVLEMVQALGGITVGEIREDQRRFDLVVRLDDRYRRDASTIAAILVPTPDGQRLPLGQLATVREIEGPATITREWQKRRIVVQCNILGSAPGGLGGFVDALRIRLQNELDLPPEYSFTIAGQYEHLQRARMRLMVIVPMALLLIVLLLYTSTRSMVDSLVILTGAPFAAIGGIVALWLRDMPFTISAGVGFVAVSGVSMLNGLVLMSTINQRLADGVPIEQAIEQTRLLRLRPILMTALVASLGFVPMAMNTHVGAEVQQPLATVVIGGVIADNLITLVALPAMVVLMKRRSPANQMPDAEHLPAVAGDEKRL
jgi:cobalt-zinc-cadmium resistance protein CzcA